MKCRRCRAPAIIDLRRHNAGFCRDCFLHHFREQVRRAIKQHAMFDPDDRVLVAVSGGKDSLALWDVLTELGYQVDGLYLGLGIGDYSDDSGRSVREFAKGRAGRLIEVELAADYGFDVPTGAAATRRAPCGTCGLSKRHLFNDVARREGYDVVATGHNLDDEAAVLFGNVLRWETSYMGRQSPVLPVTDGFARKVKPLFRLGERETAAYCVLRGIDYQVEECPMAAGNRHLGYKEILDELERRSPGSKAAFLFGFFDRGRAPFQAAVDEERAALGACTECGAPTPGETCAFCRLRRRACGDDVIHEDSSRPGTAAVPVQLRVRS
ncbi:MAG TPA: tRNA(Ile)-lysidine synthetase [Acidimicrobiia bacterium]|nr:tRNA(Ile)-lysidine synthetase [Acidimicrobiia bacterium]